MPETIRLFSLDGATDSLSRNPVQTAQAVPPTRQSQFESRQDRHKWGEVRVSVTTLTGLRRE